MRQYIDANKPFLEHFARCKKCKKKGAPFCADGLRLMFAAKLAAEKLKQPIPSPKVVS